MVNHVVNNVYISVAYKAVSMVNHVVTNVYIPVQGSEHGESRSH